ncbi:uncharacterized protein LOC136079335 [Hydra vulgaris]|uniref:Uncharacterized protein LOC136079335 n=1 Tax=Hydra vulgaris TaxID=6087 RepID=A0ABM4BPU3_HYDVU
MTWHDLIKRFKGSSTIDAVQQRQIDETETNRQNTGTLRGTSDKLYDDNNGSFLKIVELLAKFDSVMKEHIKRIKSKEIYSHYLGARMTEKILETLDSHGISMQDLRGQGYDNGSNMRGKQNGVQAKILHLNSRAFYVPCLSYSLNLVVK